MHRMTSYMREYRKAEKVKAKQKEYAKKYFQKPDVQARNRTKSQRRQGIIWAQGQSEQTLLAAQQNKCANPRCPNDLGENRKTWHVDHDHSITDRPNVRGLLCHGCNLALGMVKDSPSRLLGLLEYLAKNVLHII